MNSPRIEPLHSRQGKMRRGYQVPAKPSVKQFTVASQIAYRYRADLACVYVAVTLSRLVFTPRLRRPEKAQWSNGVVSSLMEATAMSFDLKTNNLLSTFYALKCRPTQRCSKIATMVDV